MQDLVNVFTEIKHSVKRRYKWLLRWQGADLWWVILCVKLMGLQGDQIFGQTFLSGKVFLEEMNIWVHGWSKAIAFPTWVGLTQSVKGLTRTIGQGKEEFFLSAAFELGYWPSWASGFRLGLTALSLLVLRPARSDWNYTIGSLGSALQQFAPMNGYNFLKAKKQAYLRLTNLQS